MHHPRVGRVAQIAIATFLTVFLSPPSHAQHQEWEYIESLQPNTLFESIYSTQDDGLLVVANGTFPINDGDSIILFQLLRFDRYGNLLWRQTPVADRSIEPVDVRETSRGWTVIGMVRLPAEKGVGLWRGTFDAGGNLLKEVDVAVPPVDSFVGAIAQDGSILIAGTPVSPLTHPRTVSVVQVDGKSLEITPHTYTPGVGTTHVAFIEPLDHDRWMAFGESYDSLMHDNRAFTWRLSPEGNSLEFVRVPWLYRAVVDNVIECSDRSYGAGVRISPTRQADPAPHLLWTSPTGDKITLQQIAGDEPAQLLPVRCNGFERTALLLSAGTTQIITIDLTGRITGVEALSLDTDPNTPLLTAPTTDDHAFFLARTLNGRSRVGRYRIEVSDVRGEGRVPDKLDLSMRGR